MTNNEQVTETHRGPMPMFQAAVPAVSCQPVLATLSRRVEKLAEAIERVERRLEDRSVQPEAPATQPRLLTAGPLVIDHDSHQATVGAIRLTLSPTEYKLLVELARTPGRTITASELMRRTRGTFSPDKSYIKVYIGRLRSKLARLDAYALCDVETVRGAGYRLVLSATATPTTGPSTAANIAA